MTQWHCGNCHEFNNGKESHCAYCKMERLAARRLIHGTVKRWRKDEMTWEQLNEVRAKRLRVIFGA
jgi:hypothetical protein